MPQIMKSRRQGVAAGTLAITDKGDLCYLVTVQIIIPMWKATPRWDTVSVLRKMLVQSPDMAKLKSVCRGSPYAEEEIINQAALAFLEFYRRVAANYEDNKARMNGDVYAGVVFSKSAKLTQGE